MKIKRAKFLLYFLAEIEHFSFSQILSRSELRLQSSETIADFLGRDGFRELVATLVQRGRDAHAMTEEGLDRSAGARRGTYGYVAHDYRVAVLDSLKDDELAGLRRANLNGRSCLVGDDVHLYLVGLHASTDSNAPALPNNPQNWPPSDRVQLQLSDIGKSADEMRTTVLFLTFTRDEDEMLDEVALRRPRIDRTGTVLGYLESREEWKRDSRSDEEHPDRDIILKLPDAAPHHPAIQEPSEVQGPRRK